MRESTTCSSIASSKITIDYFRNLLENLQCLEETAKKNSRIIYVWKGSTDCIFPYLPLPLRPPLILSELVDSRAIYFVAGHGVVAGEFSYRM